MSNQSSTSNDKPPTIQDIIFEIERKSKGGGYIYRGERELHKDPPYNGKVSSNLWREYGIEEGHFDIELVQKEMLASAKKHTGHLPRDFRPDVITSPNTVGESTQKAIDFEILTELQHYGGHTNLIDFTTDNHIALFFACDGSPDKDGRIVLLERTEEKNRNYRIEKPRNPQNRIIAQKSIFVQPPKGFIEPEHFAVIDIPELLKGPMLNHLQKQHGISTKTVYNDLHGFIRTQSVHQRTYIEVYKSETAQHKDFLLQDRS